ncbi:MAG: 4-(cytidine 5'-diphospho)-2-C-methyl-D-erythritol kinase [Planctomycetes bacterium]|nr:4-(cytidine 5'-diphospho)-2-C-methyl-D-erythritol kinase [Planctomycetota bacterium]
MRVEILERGRARVATSCKLNLWLDVIGKRPDGYHELRSLFHELAFGDELRLECEPAERSAVQFTSDDRGLESDPTNLCVRAAELWLAKRSAGAPRRIALQLVKRLPAGGGIGGGSGDAVAVLVGLETLARGSARREDLYALALELGSDCPFFLWGGTALVRGRGEHVEPLAHPLLAEREARAVLVLPGLHVPTRGVFAQFAAEAGQPFERPELEELLAARDWSSFQRALWNRLESCSLVAEPQMKTVRAALERVWPLPPAMSGSGSTYFACVGSEREAVHLAGLAREALPQARVVVQALAGARA